MVRIPLDSPGRLLWGSMALALLLALFSAGVRAFA